MKKIKLPDRKKFQEKFEQHPKVTQLIHWSRQRSLPGFLHVSIYDVGIFLYNELKRHDLFTRSNAIAFSFFLSLFPSLIVLFTLIPFLKAWVIGYLPGSEQFDFFLHEEITGIMPGVAGERLFQFIHDITDSPRFGLLSIGFLMAIYFGSNGMLALMQGFEKSYDLTFKKRSSLKKRWIAIYLTILLGVLLIGSVVLIILGNFVVGWLVDLVHLDKISEFLLNLVRWFVVVFIIYIGIGIIFRYGAPMRKKLGIISPGATLASLLCILSSEAFSHYVNQLNTYNKLYGSIGTIIVLMLWIQLNALVLLMGYELNASIAVNRDLKEEIKQEEE